MIEELLNRINVNLNSERLLSDFCKIEAIDGNKGVISYLNKNIILSDVYLTGYTSLKVGDLGVILLVGLEKKGVFLPMFQNNNISIPNKLEPKKLPNNS